MYDNNDDALEAAQHWEALADIAEDMARHEVAMGIHVGPVESTPVFHKARTYRNTAKSLRLGVETGLPHCACCLKPMAAATHG